MALSKPQRQKVMDLLIEEIGKDRFYKGFSVDTFAESQRLSKQSVYRYLHILEKKATIRKQKQGRNNKYSLVRIRNQFTLPIAGLNEDSVWRNSIKPLLNDMPEIALNCFNYAFCEMLNNAIDHSEGTEVKIAVFSDAFSVSFSIADDGIGIFTKIASALHLEEKRFAILELAKGKFTTAPESHSGEGIFFSARAAEGFIIISDDLLFSSIDLHKRRKESLNSIDSIIRSAPTDFLHGTTVLFEIFRKHDVPLSELFDQFTQSPDDYGFTKTSVPVRLLEHGDISPTFMSRSQAKRLLTRFERFERIELDFSDIDEIGQGFADEIFRVFQNHHPNSKIIANNCSQKVRRMIDHVMGSDG